jgi:HSP20 family molecular chaperone IbpA
MVSDHEDVGEPVETKRYYKHLVERMLEKILDLQKIARGRQPEGSWDVWRNGREDTTHTAQRKPHRSSAIRPNLKFSFDQRIEPLTDVFDEGNHVKVISEMPGCDRSEIMLDITGESLEIRARDSVRVVRLPAATFEVENAVANFRNGVIEVIIPKKHEKSSENAIKIE